MSLIQAMTDALKTAIDVLTVEHSKSVGEDERRIQNAIDTARNATLLAEDAEPIRRVSIRRGTRSQCAYLVIEVRTHDLTLMCDLLSERQIRLARRLAKDYGVDLEYRVDPSELPV